MLLLEQITGGQVGKWKHMMPLRALSQKLAQCHFCPRPFDKETPLARSNTSLLGNYTPTTVEVLQTDTMKGLMYNFFEALERIILSITNMFCP